MNDELVREAEGIIDYYDNHLAEESANRLKEILAALSSPCACEGREPIAKGPANLSASRNENCAYLDATFVGDETGLLPGAWVECEVLVFANEPQGGGGK